MRFLSLLLQLTVGIIILVIGLALIPAQSRSRRLNSMRKSKLLKITLGTLILAIGFGQIPIRTERLAVSDYKFWDDSRSWERVCPAVAMDNPEHQEIRVSVFFQNKAKVIREQVDTCFPPDEVVIKSFLL